METIFQTVISWLSTVGLRLLYTGVILLVGLKLCNLLLKLLKKSHTFQKLDPAVQSFLLSLLRILVYVLLFLSAAGILGIPTTSFITALASAGVAVGLALQGALSNFAGGLMLLLFHPFTIGDYIETQGQAGTVQKITVFYTFLLTVDNEQVMLPNGALTNASIKNYSSQELRRVDLSFSVAYDSSIEQVNDVLLSVARANEMVKQDPAPAAHLKSYGDSALVFFLRVWCDNADYWTVTAAVNEAVKKAFDENGISFPFPQVDVHMKDAD